MAKNDNCRITNCHNKITYKGTVCGTHKWRIAKYGVYDLPSYQGIPNIYIPRDPLPENIVKVCPVHGQLKVEDVYPKYYRGQITSYNCKQCTRVRYVTGKYEGMNSESDYQKIFESQNGVCAICKLPETMLSNNKTSIKKLSVDHCHRSDKIRGLLCQFCNSGLGYFKDDINSLESAISYLKTTKLITE